MIAFDWIALRGVTSRHALLFREVSLRSESDGHDESLALRVADKNFSPEMIKSCRVVRLCGCLLGALL